ncbi:MAG: hypothetical protein ACO1NS_05885 [Daejeonella sp.]|uniref:hypothetical protein n=1 Tax=Daejeonella sp. JGW-45 TaxID=3034148 RepID=UPI0023EB8C4A|nr:hypothetical protein [Daejeonella sp. JGW-45]
MTDQELTDKISQVFDEFEDPAAGYGWQELRKKYPEKHARPALIWWSTAAAILLMISGIWLAVPDTEVGKLAADKAGVKDQTENHPKTTETIRKDRLSTPENAVDEIPVPASGNVAINILKRSKADDKKSSAPDNKLRSSQVASPSAAMDVNMLSASLSPALPVAGNNPGQAPLITLPQPLRPALDKTDASAERDSALNVTARMLALAQPAAAGDDHLHKVEEQPYRSQKVASKNNMISFYAGSFFNYALGSETTLNFGAGFTSDIKLGNNLRLSTGLALANNSLSYNNGVPASGKEKLTFDMQPSFAAGGNNNLTTITKYDASLLALDIPLNIKYLLIPENNTLYMLAGLSSGTYLNEKYSLRYKKYNPAGFYAGQDQGSTVRTNFQTFDFARTLNISFGYSTNLGKTQNITIEPFLKYPLGGLGSEDLRFGSTGLNIKLNFSSLKK